MQTAGKVGKRFTFDPEKIMVHQEIVWKGVEKGVEI